MLPAARRAASPNARPRARAGLMSALATTALATTALVALTLPAAAQSVPREETVILSTAGSVNTIDPIAANYFQTNKVTSRIYSPLITYDMDLNIIGDLATDFAVADDVTSIDFTLRDAVFHDGAPVTPEDVAYSLDRYARIGTGIAAYIRAYDHTEVTGDKTFTIHLKEPSSLFLTELSKVFILNSALVKQHEGDDDAQAWLQGNDAGSGPYVLTGMSPAEVSLVWFDDYWEDRGKTAKALVLQRNDESATKREQLRVGDIDAAQNILQRDLEILQTVDGVTVSFGRRPLVNGVYFNTQSGPTADPKVREAITLAYDYAGGFQGIHRGIGYIPAGPLPDTLSCRPSFEDAAQDLDKAKALLAEAGQDGLTLTMRFQPAFEEQVQEATLLQSNLAEIGVTLNLEPIAFPNYLAMLSDPEQIPQMMLLAETAIFPDPGVFLASSYMSEAVGTNKSGYANPEFDALMEKAISSPDEAERCDLYKQAQEIIAEDHVFMPTYWAGTSMPYRSDRIEDPIAISISENYGPPKFELLKD